MAPKTPPIILNGNPVNGELHFTVYQHTAQTGTFKIVDIAGRTLVAKSISISSGYTPFAHNVQSLPVGTYYLSITNNQGLSLQKPIAFTKQ